MMKRIISIILALTLFIIQLVPLAQATDTVHTEHFDDGSYMVIGFDENIDHEEDEITLSFIGRLIEAIKKIINLILGKSDYKTAETEKYVHYYDKNSVRLWSVYLKGTFAYNGKTVSCTDASVRYYIYDNDWEMIYCNSEKSGAMAKANFKFKQYKLGVPLKEIEKSITLTCDTNGKTS